jgi:hypothetical protein
MGRERKSVHGDVSDIAQRDGGVHRMAETHDGGAA